MTFLGPLKSHRALHLWYRELLNVRPKERCILFLCANYLKSNKARKCVISADINAGIHPLHHTTSIVWVSFHSTIRARCHASAPDLLSAYLARIVADRIVIHGSPLLFLFFNSRPTHLNCFRIITPVFTYAPSSETSP